MNLLLFKALVRHQLLKTAPYEESMEQLRLDAVRYHKVEKSDLLKEYKELEKQVSNPAFQENKRVLTTKKYAASDEAKKLLRLKKLSKDKYVRRFLKNGEGEERSTVMQYVELKAEIDSKEFQQLNEFWKNPHRFETTPEGKLDARYQELVKNEDIQFFLHANVKALEHFERYKLAYEDDFNWARMETSDWQAGMLYPSKEFKREHSHTNELQAYNHGANVETHDGILSIRTKKEAKTAPAWDEKKGMVMKDFQYTSDIISNEKITVEEGDVVQVKVHCSGAVHHAIVLRSGKQQAILPIFYCAGSHLFHKLGSRPSREYVFTLSWQKDELIWFINNIEMYREVNSLPKGLKLHPQIGSFLPEKQRASAGSLDVDWIRVYKPVDKVKGEK